MLGREILNITKGSITAKLIGVFGLAMCSALYEPNIFADFYGVIAIASLCSPFLLLGQQYLVTDKDFESIRVGSNLSAAIMSLFLASLFIYFENKYWIAILICCYLQSLMNLARMSSVEKGSLNFFLSLVAISVFVGECIKVGFGIYGWQYGMIIGHMVAILIPTLSCLSFSFKISVMINNLVQFKVKLILRLFATTLQNSAIHLVPIFLTALVADQVEVGKFLLALAVVSMPSLIFGKYINDLFYVQFSRDRVLANRYIGYLICFYLIVLCLYEITNKFFNVFYIFGFMSDEWTGIINYLQSLIYLCFAQLIMNPILQYYYQQKLRVAIIINTIRLILVMSCCFALFKGYIVLSGFGMAYSISILVLSVLVIIYHWKAMLWK